MESGTHALPLDRASAWRRASDYVQLTKPRLVTLVLVTTLVGFAMGSTGGVDVLRLAVTIAGTALAAAGAMALNQVMEKDLDGRMERTRLRPLPDGRLLPREGLVFGSVCTAAGLVLLAAGTNLLAAAVTALTVASYLLVYTPLKPRTSLSTLAGAVPGALPPVTGWVAAHGSLDAGAAALFAILFFWQLPHFLALAFLYRDEYARAGFVVLPSRDPDGGLTARQILLNLLVLFPAALLPAVVGMAGAVYATGAVALCALFLATGIAFARAPSRTSAKRVFFASLGYLPALLALLVIARNPV